MENFINEPSLANLQKKGIRKFQDGAGATHTDTLTAAMNTIAADAFMPHQHGSHTSTTK
jgi:hypothetical protein